MKRPPDFFMSTAGEYEPLAAPRACWQEGRLSDERRDDYMLVEIEPPLDGQRFGLGDANVTTLILSSRHSGQTLFPISEWPSFVYVARVLDDAVRSSLAFTGDQVELIAWGTLFRSRQEAADFERRHSR